MDILKVLLTSLISLVILFLLTKLMGNKQISQMNLFDYIVGITIGSIAAELATNLEDPWLPAIAMAIYSVASVIIAICTNKSNRLRRLFAGKPIILMRNGKLSREKLKKARMDVNEFLAMARISGFFDLSQLDTAIFEHNGHVSFLPKAAYRPANPDDMKLPVEREALPVNVIVDGNVMEKELKLAGRDLRWLQNELRIQGFSGTGEVFLACVDGKGSLTAFGVEEEK